MRAQIDAKQADAVNPVPPATGSTPYLVVKGAKDAVAWYQKVFGAQVVMQMDAPDNKLMHAELKVGSAQFMLTEERPEHQALSPLTLGGSSSSALLYVSDTDAVVKQAVASGARITMPVADQFWGDRSGHLIDPFGHQWFISTHKEDLTPQQVSERLQKLFG
nr:VOC family protein [Rhizobacter sp. SG703]